MTDETAYEKRRIRLYKVWSAIQQRCENPNHISYKNYGGRGIKLCKRWKKFKNFLFDMGIPEKGMTIDRIDNNKGYNRKNCQWVSLKENANNKRDNHVLEFNGIKKTISEWSDQTGIKQNTIVYRIKRGWRVSEALEFENRINKRLANKLKRKRSCLVCGVEFIPRASQVKEGGGNYCSVACANSVIYKTRKKRGCCNG